jgi:hypothetical protein
VNLARRPATAARLVALLVVVLVAGCASSGKSARPSDGAGAPGSTAKPAGSSWVAAENARPGTPGWAITKPANGRGLAGWAGASSVSPGTAVKVYVSTTAPTFTVHALRIGWYAGAGAREVWASRPVPGVVQPPAVTDAGTRAVSAPWAPSLTVPTTGWPAGDYLLRLDASSGVQSYVPLTLRTDDNAGRLLISNAVTTWQAYDLWGGRSLYTGPGGSAGRSYAVSFDRPYDTFDGAGLFLVDEMPAVRLAEQLGLDLGYTTSVDLDRDAHALDGARALVTLGHDEYWSLAMRTRLTAARDRGMNVAFLGANAIFRHIRMEPTSTGPERLEVNYRQPKLDPLYGKNDDDVTADWPSPPHPRPESALTGGMYECNPVLDPMVVSDASSWVFSGAGVHDGSSFPDLVGSEYDRVDPALPVPRPIEVLAHSRVTCRGLHSFADMTYYSTPSGAGVIDVGTNMWVRALDHAAGKGPDIAVTYGMTAQVTSTVLRAFAAGPAGKAHPAVDNLESVHPYSGDVVGTKHQLW